MVTTSNPQIQDPTVPTPQPTPSPGNELENLIAQWEKDGVTLELIVAMIMSNPEGIGAMDVVSDDISGITQQSNILSKVQSDIITLNAILSKIESQLGDKADVSSASVYAKMKSQLLQFQSAYKNLFVSDSANADGKSDIDELAEYQKQFPTLDPIVKGVKQWQGDFNSTLNGDGRKFSDDLLHWDGGNDGGLLTDVAWLAGQHYSANHPTSDGGKSGAIDYLQNWWTDGNADQQLVSGQSQEDTTQVQSYMQLLQGFDSSAQQDIQLASTQKSQLIQNEKTS